MASSKRRLDKLEVSLTPKQAILLWMEEAHQYDTMEQYARSLKPGPDSSWPLAILPEKVASAVEQAMKGRSKQEIARVARQAIRDVLFLFHLHQRVNQKFMEEDRHYWTRALLLSTELDALRRERSLRDQMTWSWFRVGLELPYPLDPMTAAAVDALKEHYVLTWDLLEEGDEISGWVVDYFIAQGKTALPAGAYSFQEEGERRSTKPTEEDVRALFADETEFQKFLTSEDYSYGLADVTDREFEAKWDSVYQAIKGLVELGKLQEGAVMELPTAPHQLLREAALVEGEWLDRYVVALAEWGARLQTKGYILQEPEDSHPLAWHRIVDPATGEEAEASIQDKLWQQTKKRLDIFPGRTRYIQDSPYFYFQDYLRWRGRKARGGLKSAPRRGVVLSSWNEWVAGSGGEGKASLEGVQVSHLSSYLDSYSYRLQENMAKAEEARRRRESLLEPLRAWKSESSSNDQFQQRGASWKEMAENFLIEVYSFQEMAIAISQRYFSGYQVLLPLSVADFNRLIECIEHLAEGYNLAFDTKLSQASSSLENPQKAPHQHLINTSAQRMEAMPVAQRQMVFLVDLSRAEALDAMGESQNALELIDRHV
jgi:hypothetical protein